MAERNNRCWVVATDDGWERLDNGAALQPHPGWQEVRDLAAGQWLVRNTSRFWIIFDRGRRPGGFLAPPDAVEQAESEATLAAFTGERIKWVDSDTSAPPQNGPAARRNLERFHNNLRREVLGYLRFDMAHEAEADGIADRVGAVAVKVLDVPAGLPFEPTVTPSVGRLMARAALAEWLHHGLRFGFSYGPASVQPGQVIDAALDRLVERRIDALLAERREPGAATDDPIDLDGLLAHLQQLEQGQRHVRLWHDLQVPVEPRAPKASRQAEARSRHAARRAGNDIPLRRRLVADCGTPAGYRRHRRLNESPCDECRQAEAAAVKARRSTATPS